MKSRSKGKGAGVILAAMLAAVLAAGLAAALAGCGSTVNPAVLDHQTKVAAPSATSPPAAGSAPSVSQPSAGTEAPESAEPPAVGEQLPAPTEQAAPSPEATVENDCPFYDNGICTRTGEACVDCR